MIRLKRSLLVLLLVILNYIQKTKQDWTNILIIGDSNDRNLVIHMCDLYRGNGTNFGGDDFFSQNGVISTSWCSRDHHYHYHGYNGYVSFPKDTTTNWSDLRCDLYLMNITLFYLQVFGAADEPPYYLNLCSSGKDNDGPYCSTKSRITRGIELIHKQQLLDKNIDIILFESIGWDVSLEPKALIESEIVENYKKRISQLQELSSQSLLVLRTQPVGDECKTKIKVDEYNKVIRKIIKEYSNVFLLDLTILDTSTWFIPKDHFHYTDEYLHQIFNIMMITFDTLKKIKPKKLSNETFTN